MPEMPPPMESTTVLTTGKAWLRTVHSGLERKRKQITAGLLPTASPTAGLPDSQAGDPSWLNETYVILPWF